MTAPATSGLLILFGGIPGAGKSTLARHIFDGLGESARMVVSSEYREKLGLQNPFVSNDRKKLQLALAQAVDRHVADGARCVVVDSNLLEVEARSILSRAAGDFRTIFVAAHASLEVLLPRVAAKFGKGYMYPEGRFSAQSVVDHSLSAGEPVTLEEATERFSCVLQVFSDSGVVRVWTEQTRVSPLEQAVIDRIVNFEASCGENSAGSPTALDLLTTENLWMWDPEVDGLAARAPERPVTYHRRRSIAGHHGMGTPQVEAQGLLEYAESYVGGLRSRVGTTQLIVPSVRIVALDERSRVLLVRRSDTGKWRLPGGSQELDESVEDTARRELREEAGLSGGSFALVSVRSGRGQVHVDAFGNTNQGLVFTFRATNLRGLLSKRTVETIDAQWSEPEQIRGLPARHENSLRDALEFTGQVVVR